MKRRVRAIRLSDEEWTRIVAAVESSKALPSRNEKLTPAVVLREATMFYVDLLTKNTVETTRADLARQVYSLLLGGTLLDTTNRG